MAGQPVVQVTTIVLREAPPMQVRNLPFSLNRDLYVIVVCSAERRANEADEGTEVPKLRERSSFSLERLAGADLQ